MVDIIGKGMDLAGELATGIAGGGPNLIAEGRKMADAGIKGLTEAVMPTSSNIHATHGLGVSVNEK